METNNPALQEILNRIKERNQELSVPYAERVVDSFKRMQKRGNV